MEFIFVFILGIIFLTGLFTLSAGLFRLFFQGVGCLLVLPVILMVLVVFTAFASMLFVPAMFLAGVILVLAGILKLIA